MELSSREVQITVAKQHLELELHRLNFVALNVSSHKVHGVMYKLKL